jgi:hypothetical protein
MHDEQYTAELAASLRDVGEIKVCLSGRTALMLVGQLQLAMRHPANNGPSRQAMGLLIDGIASRLPPLAQELIVLGSDPENDVRVRVKEPRKKRAGWRGPLQRFALTVQSRFASFEVDAVNEGEARKLFERCKGASPVPCHAAQLSQCAKLVRVIPLDIGL